MPFSAVRVLLPLLNLSIYLLLHTVVLAHSSGDRSFDRHMTTTPSPVTGYALQTILGLVLVWSMLCAPSGSTFVSCFTRSSLSPWRMAPINLPLAYLCLTYDTIFRSTSLLNYPLSLPQKNLTVSSLYVAPDVHSDVGQTQSLGSWLHASVSTAEVDYYFLLVTSPCLHCLLQPLVT